MIENDVNYIFIESFKKSFAQTWSRFLWNGYHSKFVNLMPMQYETYKITL